MFSLIVIILFVILFFTHEVLFLPKYKVFGPGSAILITGASKGIGRDVTLHLVENGYKVYAGVRKESDGESLIKEATEKRGVSQRDLLEPIILDVQNSDHIAAAVKHCQKNNDKHQLFAVVNNAGVSARYPFEFAPDSDWRSLISINLIGAMDVTRQFIPLIREARGRFVHIGSLAGEQAVPFGQTYSTSKFGIRAFSDGLRRELALAGVHSSVVEPGYVTTGILEKSLNKARETWQLIPESLHSTYAYLHPQSVDAIAKNDQQANAVTVDWTTRDIAHALLDEQPRARYLTATLSQRTLVSLGWYLPDWLADLIHYQRMQQSIRFINQKSEL